MSDIISIQTEVNAICNQRLDDLLDKGLTKLKDARKDLDKVKPDLETYSATGEKVSAGFTKAKFEELKKAQDLVDRIQKAVDQALGGEGFDKLRDLVSK